MKLGTVISRILALAAIVAIAGCAHLATHEEKEVSYQRFKALTVNGIYLDDFLHDRTAYIVAGAEPAGSSSHSGKLEVQLQPVSSEGFDIGSASAITNDGYFLTAAHCVKRKPLYLLVPAESGTNIVAARLVWHASQNSACDIAILKVENGLHPAFTIADDEQIHAAADVVTSGVNGMAGGNILSESVAVAADRTHDMPAVFAIVHSAPLAEGDSGGPLATVDGKLIGIEVLARGLPLGKSQGIALRPDPHWIEQIIKNDRQSQLRGGQPATQGQ